MNWFRKKKPDNVYRISGGNNSPYWGNPEEMIAWHPTGETFYNGGEQIVDGFLRVGPQRHN